MIRWRSVALMAGVSVVIVFGHALTTPAGASAAPCSRPFEITSGSFQIVPSTLQAGAHADLTTTFDFVHSGSQVCNDVRNVVVKLPAGFIGNNTAVSACTQSQLFGSAGELGELPACPPASAVGTITYLFGGEKFTQPIYNMETTSFGVTAEYGFKFAHAATIELLISVRPLTNAGSGDPGGLSVTSSNIESIGETREDGVTIWGVPAAHEHDVERQRVCQGELCTNELGGPVPANIAIKPYLANPTNCDLFTAELKADSWEAPEEWAEASTDIGPISGCERVPFEPSIEVQPTTASAESPSGLNVILSVGQSWSDPYTIATSDLKDTRIVLPEGMTINPSSGAGLGACTPQQFAAETSSSLPGEGCSSESKIGSIEIETPLIAEKPMGAVYVATPFDNPFQSLLSLYIIAKLPERGIVVKLAGEVQLDEKTGQIVTTFLNNPQVPFSKLTLKFRTGPTATLVSPPACDSYTAQAALTPWSAPYEPRMIYSQPFLISTGVNGASCPTSDVPALKPTVVSGTKDNVGGYYSPLYARIAREDGEQEITKFTTVMPPGLTGNLTGIPLCSDADIDAARHASGTHEMLEPSCPAASEIGHTIVGAGVGPVLAQTPGRVYLAGPYNGSPLSIVSITSATVGPFDLGAVVVRFALRINPATAQVEVGSAGSDSIPHIIKGIVVHVRDIRVYIDRKDFILNPTNCAPMSLSDTITGAGADPTNPADQRSVTVASPFQAANCSNLRFKPTFKVFTSGKTSRSKGASLSVRLTYPKAPQGTQANIRSVRVDLPKQLPSRLTTLQKACPDSTFAANPAICPPASKVGVAKAITPILPVPLMGPAYFVSHGGAMFPELVIVLEGYGIQVVLRGETYINKKGITSSTFRAIPDQPVTSFELTLPEGANSALAANGRLCNKRLKLSIAIVAQNGDSVHKTIPMAVQGCPRRGKRGI